MTELTAVPWRTGRTGRTVYARTGGDNWKADTVIGMIDTPELAEEACAAHNAALLAGKPEESTTGEKRHAPREHLAWLMWCYEQGYTNPADRAILTNWMGDDPATLTPNDVKTRRALLGMADEILALVADREEP